jgi:murein L,D-transpeptidase YcbB/YkuD
VADGRGCLVVLGLSLSIWFTGCGPSHDAPPTPSSIDAVRAAVESKTRPAYVRADDRGTHVWKEVRRVYKENGYAPVWNDGRKPRSQMDGLLRALQAANQEGLDPAAYGVDELTRSRQAFDAAHSADSDLRFTYAYLAYASDMAHGTVDPEDIDSHWHAAPRDVDLHEALMNALDQNRIEESLQRLAPSAPQYLGLKHQLAHYLGMPPNSPPVAMTLPDGDTQMMPIAAVVDLIAINMDRYRWLPDDLGSRYLLVNIPAFRIDAIEDGKSVLDMKVVTGTEKNATPVLADRMTSVVFSPYWNIPRDIAEKEMAPKEEKDPGYLERNNIEVDEAGRYRQRPGKGNSLGQVKFLFPNHFNVYLHDTPAANLFNKVERDFSHGCVRLERPLDLALYVLRDQPEWTRERITAAMNSGTEQAVALKQPLPVYLVYFTAWEENGALQVRKDVYGHDRRHRVAVDQ